MTSVVNTEQAGAWNGPEGRHWARQQSRGGGMNVALDTPLFAAAAIEPADRVLDVGCGTGDTTRRAGRTASAGRALGLDLSEPMLAVARAAAAGQPNVTFEQGDAQVHPLRPATFDVAISRFGVMFFADPVAAFTNIRRALRPGGRLAFVCPRAARDNAWYAVPGTALLGPGTEQPESGMFSLADAGLVESVLDAAGFAGITCTALDVPLNFGPDAVAAAGFYLGSGPVRALLADPASRHTRDTARDALEAALAPYEGPAGVEVPGAHWLVTAHR